MIGISVGISLRSTQPGTPATGGATFSDNFDRPDENLEASPNWTKVTGVTVGAAQVVGNQLVTTTTAENAYLSPDMGSANQYIEYVGATPGSAGPFVCCRMTDGDNWFGMRASTTSYQIWKRVGNVLTSAGTLVGTPTAGDTLRLELVGDTFNAYINGVLNLTGSIGTDIPASTRQGVTIQTQIRNPWIDNYKTGTM